MNNVWLKIKVWTKIVVFGLGAVYILAFVFKNTGSDRTIKFWWWIDKESQTSVFVLALLSFFVGVLATLLVRTTWITYRQIQNMQNRNRSVRLEREVAEMKTKAAMLQSRQAAPAGPAPLPESGGPRPL